MNDKDKIQADIVRRVSEEAMKEMKSKSQPNKSFIHDFIDWIDLVKVKLIKYLN